MNAHNSDRIFGLFVAATSLATLAAVNVASAASIPAISDELLITIPGGAAPIFDSFIAEVGPAAGEATLTFTGGPLSVPPPIPLAVAIGLPGVSVIVLTEPAGELPEPGEIPIVIPGPNEQPVVVSDVIISTLGPQVDAPPFITLVSDGGPDMAEIGPLLPGVPGKIFLPETGALQDLTPFLPGAGVAVGPFGPISVFVRSDINVPEPSSVAIIAAGLAGLLAFGWRRLPLMRTVSTFRKLTWLLAPFVVVVATRSSLAVIIAGDNPFGPTTLTTYNGDINGFSVVETVSYDGTSGSWHKELINGGNQQILSGQQVPIDEQLTNAGPRAWTDWHEEILANPPDPQFPDFLFVTDSLRVSRNGVALTAGVDFTLVPTAASPGLGISPSGDWVALSIFFSPSALIQPGDTLGITKRIFEVFGDANIWDQGEGALIAEHPSVPEPSSIGLAAFGLVGLMAWGWRRRKR